MRLLFTSSHLELHHNLSSGLTVYEALPSLLGLCREYSPLFLQSSFHRQLQPEWTYHCKKCLTFPRTSFIYHMAEGKQYQEARKDLSTCILFKPHLLESQLSFPKMSTTFFRWPWNLLKMFKVMLNLFSGANEISLDLNQLRAVKVT